MMNIDIDTINQIIASVFEEMLTMSTEFFDAGDAASDGERVVASIRISGGLEGIVVVEAPTETAQQIAETMFATDGSRISDEEVCDAVGEIVNMIGGNIKGLSDGVSQLSLPCVSRETVTPTAEIPLTSMADVLVSGLPLKVYWHHLAEDTAAV
ncbi:MAG: chemotaxis protein CheX [Planctomycetaceae bacterium]